MKDQNKINQQIKEYFKSKGYVLAHMEHHFYVLCYEGNVKIIKIGKAPKASNFYRLALSKQNTKTYQANTMDQAKKIVGEKTKLNQSDKLLLLLMSAGRDGVDSELAKKEGVLNVTASIKVLERKGHSIMKIPRKGIRRGRDFRTLKVFYVYTGKVRGGER